MVAGRAGGPVTSLMVMALGCPRIFYSFGFQLQRARALGSGPGPSDSWDWRASMVP
jgi:hypothetical protein